MAAKEMYDYLSSATADYTATTLSVSPQRVLTEQASKRVIIREGDDRSEERITLDNDNIFYVTLQWDILSEEDSGTIFDFYNDSAKGNGTARTIQWTHPTDGHTYVVRFADDLSRSIIPGVFYGIGSIRMKVMGYV